MQRSLSMIIYGPTKVGKSTLGATAPYPRLMLDLEGGNPFLPIVQRVWDPLREPPPVADGTWDTCVMQVVDYETVVRVHQVLMTGQHQFASLIIDSISEVQQRFIDGTIGRVAVSTPQWGEVFRHMAGLLRDLRDLTKHPTNPLQMLVLTAMEKEGSNGKVAPWLQGQVAVVAPYLFDLIVHLDIEIFPNPDPMQPPSKIRRLLTVGDAAHVAGERVQGRIAEKEYYPFPSGQLRLDGLLDKVFGPMTVIEPPTQEGETV